MGNTFNITNIKNPAVYETLNELITNISVGTSTFCSAGNYNNQTMIFKNITSENCNVYFSNINQTINSNVSAECISNIDYREVLENALKKTMTENKANLSGEESTKITNIIKNNVNVESLMTCISNNINNQAQHYTDLKVICPSVITKDMWGKITEHPGELRFENISQQITATNVLSCVNKISPQLINKLNTEVGESNSNSENSNSNKNEKLPDYAIALIVILAITIFSIILGISIYFGVIKHKK